MKARRTEKAKMMVLGTRSLKVNFHEIIKELHRKSSSEENISYKLGKILSI